MVQSSYVNPPGRSTCLQDWILLAVAIIMSPACSWAQETAAETVKERSSVVVGIKAGINSGQFSTGISRETRAKVGPAFGIYIRKSLGLDFYFRPEVFYSVQGRRTNYVYPYGGPSIGSTTTTLHYLNAPFLIEAGRKFCAQFGVQAGLLLAGREQGRVASVDVDDDLDDTTHAAEISIVMGAGYNIGSHLNLGARFNYGMTDVFETTVASSPYTLPSVRNRVLHFFVAWSF
jgi:hypothetical protein